MTTPGWRYAVRAAPGHDPLMDIITQKDSAGTPAQPPCRRTPRREEASLQAARPGGGCVHFEHTGRWEAENAETRPELATAPATMSSYRLLVCLAILGWSERDLTRRTDRHQTTIVRWVKNLSPVPGEVAAWLETLVAFHVAHPAPRRKRLEDTAHQHHKQGVSLPVVTNKETEIDYLRKSNAINPFDITEGMQR